MSFTECSAHWLARLFSQLALGSQVSLFTDDHMTTPTFYRNLGSGLLLAQQVLYN